MLYRVSYPNIAVPPVSIHAPTAKDAATIFYFKHSDPHGDVIEATSADGTVERFSVDEIGLTPSADVPSHPRTVALLSKRYKDAYTEAHAVVAVGKTIKGVGTFLFIGVTLAGFFLASNQRANVFPQLAIAGLVFACMVGIPIYVLGILVSAQGQTALATLDTAVNSSRHLTNDEVADILAKRFSL